MNLHTPQWIVLTVGSICVLLAAGTMGVSRAVADEWTAMQAKPPAGISEVSWHRLLDNFREKPYSVAEIQPSLREVEMATRDGLPVDAVVIRLVEGVVKQADGEALARAVRRRVGALRQAREILCDPGLGPLSNERQQGMLSVVASALESRVPVGAIYKGLKTGGGLALCRMQTVMEAGESLKLMGLNNDAVTDLMSDFVTRELCCGEMLRAARLAGKQRRDGVPDAQIRAQLWQGKGSAKGGGCSSCGPKDDDDETD